MIATTNPQFYKDILEVFERHGVKDIYSLNCGAIVFDHDKSSLDHEFIYGIEDIKTLSNTSEEITSAFKLVVGHYNQCKNKDLWSFSFEESCGDIFIVFCINTSINRVLSSKQGFKISTSMILDCHSINEFLDFKIKQLGKKCHLWTE